MLSNNLCPSCCQFYGEFPTLGFSYHGNELYNHASSNYPDLYNSQKCSNCGKLFSLNTQGYTEQFANEASNSGVQTYFYGSSSWTNQTYQPDFMNTEYFQERYEDGNHYNNTDATHFDENFSNNPVTCEYLELGKVYNDQIANKDGNSHVETYFYGPSSTQEYQPHPLGSECIQNHLQGGDNGSNIVDPFKIDENLLTDEVTDEYLNLINAVINGSQEYNVGEFERFRNGLDCGENAETTASETLERQKTPESELAQENSMTTVVETQSNVQPQVATGSHSTIAPEDTRECEDNLKQSEPRRVYPFRRRNQNRNQSTTVEPQSNVQPQVASVSRSTRASSDTKKCNDNWKRVKKVYSFRKGNGVRRKKPMGVKKPRAPKGAIYDNNVYPIYTIDTNQRVFKDEIVAKIESSMSDSSVVARDEQSFICQFAPDCHKILVTSRGIKNHIFSHFYFYYCKFCNSKYQHPSSLRHHFRTCKPDQTGSIGANCIQSAGAIRNQLDVDFRLLKPCWVKFDDTKHPIYRKNTLEKVTIDEIMAKLSTNFAIFKRKNPVYVCLIDHDCNRSYSTFIRLTDHIFCQLFFYKCLACGNDLSDPSSIRKHVIICKRQCDKMLAQNNGSVSDESNSMERESSSNQDLDSSFCSTDDSESM